MTTFGLINSSAYSVKKDIAAFASENEIQFMAKGGGGFGNSLPKIKKSARCIEFSNCGNFLAYDHYKTDIHIYNTSLRTEYSMRGAFSGIKEIYFTKDDQ